MKTSHFSKYLFWSYKENADLPEKVVVRRVLSYGEVQDLLTLNKMIQKNTLEDILTEWKERERFKKRINFFNKVIAAE